MDIRSVTQDTIDDFMAGNAVMWISPPGFGKTDNVGNIAKWMLKTFPNEELGMSTLFMATSNPTAFTGLPWKGSLDVEWNGAKHQYTITDPAIPTWYVARDLKTGEVRPANLFHRVLLVIEEWGQGDAETKRAGADLLLHGGAGKYYLPPGSFRLALSNNDPRDGVTKEFDFIINRVARKTITEDVKVWIEDFADRPYKYAGREWQVMGVTKAWAARHSEILFEPKPKEQGPWCSPRSMTAADRYTQVVAERNNGVIPLTEGRFLDGLAGKIGMGATTSFVSDLQFRLELPSLEDVARDPAGTPIPSKVDLQMMMVYELSGLVQKDQLTPVVQYISRFTNGMQVTFVQSLLRRDYNLLNEPVLSAWMSKNATLVSLIGTLVQH